MHATCIAIVRRGCERAGRGQVPPANKHPAGRAAAAVGPPVRFGQACAAAGPPRPGRAAATFDFGRARHRADTRLRTREPVRAEIVLGRQAGGPDHWPGCQPTPQGQWGGLGGSVPTPRELNVSAS